MKGFLGRVPRTGNCVQGRLSPPQLPHIKDRQLQPMGKRKELGLAGGQGQDDSGRYTHLSTGTLSLLPPRLWPYQAAQPLGQFPRRGVLRTSAEATEPPHCAKHPTPMGALCLVEDAGRQISEYSSLEL